MPRRSLTKEERAEALQRWWATFPYGDIGQRLEAVHKFEQEYGPLTEDEMRAAVHRWSPELKAKLGISKGLWAEDILGKKEALKLCVPPAQLLDDRHYDPDLLLDETGIIETSTPEPTDDGPSTLCILLR